MLERFLAHDRAELGAALADKYLADCARGCGEETVLLLGDTLEHVVRPAPPFPSLACLSSLSLSGSLPLIKLLQSFRLLESSFIRNVARRVRSRTTPWMMHHTSWTSFGCLLELFAFFDSYIQLSTKTERLT